MQNNPGSLASRPRSPDLIGADCVIRNCAACLKRCGAADPLIEVGIRAFYLSLKASDPILAKGESR
jgi:hypothetical protein